MATTKKPKELILNGSTLSNDDTLQDLVNDFKSQISSTKDTPVVLDISEIGAIYSKGIAIVLGLFKDCKASNRPFKIQVGTDDILNLFKMLKLDKVITIDKVEKK